VNAGTCRQSRQLPSTTGVVLAWGRSRLRRCTLIRDLRAPGRDNSQSSAFNRPGYIGVKRKVATCLGPSELDSDTALICALDLG
jgi:hypothetical protein